MRVLVQHEGRQWGPFSEEEVRRALAEGRFRPGDLAWCEGLPAWAPLSSVIVSGPAPGAFGAPASPTSGLAVASLVLGASSTFFCILAGIPAIVCGLLARTEIRRSGGRMQGDGMAVAGLVLGYLSVAMLLPIAMFLLFFVGSVGMSLSHVAPAIQVEAASPQYPVNAAMQVFRACKAFAADHGGRFPETLEELVPFYLPDQQLLASPLVPEEKVGYFYYGGVETDVPSEPLLLSKGEDELGRQIVIRKNGALILQRGVTGRRVIAHAD
ncbi:MAG: DUF4190 domain-containing protein [Verrucomicrobiaceae bacterium]|nr:MAG: DUF4190 domain-containing protein [Verrucomicrobiaceae bacterium]